MKKQTAELYVMNQLIDRDLNIRNPNTLQLYGNASHLLTMGLTKSQINKYIDEAIDLHDLNYYNA